MSTPLEDFIISLGFDTSKLKKQIEDVHKSLGELATSADDKRVKTGLAAEKKIADNAVNTAKDTSEKKQKIVEKEYNSHIAAYQKAQKKMRVVDEQAARRMQAVNKLTSRESNPQLQAMGSFYRKLQNNQSEFGNKSEMNKRRRALGTLKNNQYFQDLKKDFGTEGRRAAAEYLIQARSALRSGKIEKFRDIRSGIQKNVRDRRTGRAATTSSSIDNNALSQKFLAMQQIGAFSNFSERQMNQIRENARNQQSQRAANSYLSAAQGANKLGASALRSNKVGVALDQGSVQTLRAAAGELRTMNAEMNRLKRNSIGAAAAMGSLHDSTRNMVREYASLYALFAGVSSINRVGQEFEALDSAMMAAYESSGEAANQMQFMIDLSRRLGLGVKEITDQYVKFSFAAKGKLSTEQTQEIFTNMSELGTVLGLSQEKMKLSFNAITQIYH